MKVDRIDVFSSRMPFDDAGSHAIAARLIEIAHYLCVQPPSVLEPEVLPGSSGDREAPARLIRLATEELRRRRIKSQYLPREAFGDGIWIMLLDLFVSQSRGQRVSTKSACIAADVPERTALRWLEEAERDGLVERVPCQRDKRVKYVTLTGKGEDAVRSILSRYCD